MDHYGDKQPPRTYPFFKGQGSRSQPITGHTTHRIFQKVGRYQIPILALNNTSAVDTGNNDITGVTNKVDLGKICGTSSADDFVLVFDKFQVSISEETPLAPDNTYFNILGLALYFANENAGALGGVPSQVYAISPILPSLPAINVAYDFGPQIRPIRWDDFAYMDNRTMRLNNVFAHISFAVQAVSGATTVAHNVQVQQNLQYRVQNLADSTLPVEVQS